MNAPIHPETRTHALDLKNITRKGSMSSLEEESIALQVENLQLYYGEKRALHGITMQIPEKRVTAFYRTLRLWKVDAVALF